MSEEKFISNLNRFENERKLIELQNKQKLELQKEALLQDRILKLQARGKQVMRFNDLFTLIENGTVAVVRSVISGKCYTVGMINSQGCDSYAVGPFFGDDYIEVVFLIDLKEYLNEKVPI